MISWKLIARMQLHKHLNARRLAPRARFELGQKSKCPIWCRLQEIGSHFPFSSCTQCCTQNPGDRRRVLHSIAEKDGRRACPRYNDDSFYFFFLTFLAGNSSRSSSPSTGGFPLPTRARIRLTLAGSARRARSSKYSSVRIAETFSASARVISWLRATPSDSAALRA